MRSMISKVKANRKIRVIIKIILSACILTVILQSLLIDGIDPYYSYKDYECQNEYSEGQGRTLQEHHDVAQTFTAQGNILDHVSLYIGEARGGTVTVAIYSSGDERIAESEMDLSKFANHAWNKIDLSVAKLSRGETYSISVSSDSGLGFLYSSSSDAPAVFGGCKAEGNDMEDTLAIGLQFTYRYLTLGSMFEFALKMMLSLLMGIIMCFSVLNIERFIKKFQESSRKKGFSYALYFSVSLILLYNPLETIQNEMTEFSRVIGGGVVANVDVSKRISNFNRWFILFAIAFSIFFLFFNDLLQRKKNGEARKVVRFLNHFMVLANCSLALRCIAYFNEPSPSSAYYFSAYGVMMIAVIALCYICFHLDQSISADTYAKLHLMGVTLSVPLAIFVALEWGAGRVLLGVEAIVAILIIAFCRFGKKAIAAKYFEGICNAGVLGFSLIPLLTSLYIELVHILNQHKIFVAHPAVCYQLAIMPSVFILCGASAAWIWKKGLVRNCKSWAYPWLILGIAFLSIQIPISSEYGIDLMEGANSGVLISDFLNHGTIPIVQHYGGHMMTSVWEGIIYGIINGDYAGAAVSPYSSLIAPFLVILFYFLVKKIWNRDIALPVTLLFPFYDSWSYYGLGMLVCLAAMNYVRKNGYARAAFVWAAFAWCALYRLDLGFAFGLSVIISFMIYILANRNWKAIRELGLTLLGWGLFGGITWTILCLVNDIHPINRLIEFIKISMSNQNWGYAGIGNTGNTIFAWCYLFIPLSIALCLIYTVFSKSMRERIGNEKWMLLLILGWSYFGNFSRGLVRHSLAESFTIFTLWCAYLFLAVFLCCYKGNKKLFLPAFMLLILCNTLFVQDENFSYRTLAGDAMAKPASIIESWELGRFSQEEYALEQNQKDDEEDQASDGPMTYWEQLKKDKTVVDRVKVNDDIKEYIGKFKAVLDVLLEEEDTFVDFINKTMIYPLLGKENPVYVSQSPLQLSGEFAQNEYIKEMEGVPLVLMPVDDGYAVSKALDGIANHYRYYKVAEYIYQKYKPLCKFKSDFAIWCLKEEYDKYKNKLSSLITGVDYVSKLTGNDYVITNNVTLSPKRNGAVAIASTGTDPMITELQNIIDTSWYENRDMRINIDYRTDIPGTMQLFYTGDKDESYHAEKVASAEIAGQGTADFVIPITKYTKIRLDIPEGSTVTVKSLVVKSSLEYIDYGYDGPFKKDDGNGNISYEYMDILHNHSIGQLPRIWAEGDRKGAAGNSVVAESRYEDGMFIFDRSSFTPDENGNYIKITATYAGLDADGLYRGDDEQLAGIVVLGTYKDDEFEEKCRYEMTFKEGTHDYLIRCSSDYFWYTGEINAMMIQSDDVLQDQEAQILKGD